MTIGPGARLGPYEVVDRLGQGGMGEVWRARDTRLNRVVAIKVLPSQLASDPQFRERFDREAKAIAALSHPHICTLHDVGQQDVTGYLVMEYLEGETLESRLERGALPIDQALTYAVQIADALDTAHRAGIVHRDLKPGNVMLTKSGAKLLDFGLAKTPAADSMTAASMLPTTPVTNLTAQGTILGTFQYMAPEQLEGREVDARTDIFAFGSLVYEMLTGTRAFQGQSQASLIASIMQGQPPSLQSRQPLTPPLLEHIVMRCLAKDPGERWQSCADLKHQLRWIAAAGPANDARATSAPRRPFAMLIALGSAIAVVITAAVLWIASRDSAVEPMPIRFSISLPAGGGNANSTLALSPDGSKLVYDAPGLNNPRVLWLRPLDRSEEKAVPGTEGASLPFWSPDSRFVAFFADRKLKKIELSTGNIEKIADASPSPGGGTWSRDDVIVFAPFIEGSLSRVSAAGGAAATLTTLDAQHGETNHVWPHFLPDGQHYLFQLFGRDNSGIYVASLGSGERKRLIAQPSIDNTSIAYSPAGYVVYTHDRTLWAQRFDAKRLELTGDAVRLAEGFSIGGPGRPRFTISQTGVLAYRPEDLGRIVQPTWVQRDGSRVATIGSPGSFNSFDLSPDGRTLAVERRSDGNLDTSIWLTDVERGTATKFTNDAYSARPIWSPDGNRIAFSSARDSPPNLFLKSLSGSEERLEKAGTQTYATDWSPDGRLLYTVTDPKTKGDIWLMSVSGDRKADAILQSPANEVGGHISPDGRWMAFSSDESGRNEVYVTSFPTPGRKWPVSTGGATQPRWRADGKELFFLTQRKVASVSITLGPAPQIGTPTELFALPPGNDFYVAAKDGKRFLVPAESGSSPAPVIQVVVNWMASLKK